jgi:hypothetical protein
MASSRTYGLGIVGAAVTMLARNATRRAMHDSSGRPRLPRARRPNSVTTLLIVAAASGALLALLDVLPQHRRELGSAT